jgi:hypothetical protein
MARVQAIRALESLADASEHHIGAAPLQTPGLTIAIHQPATPVAIPGLMINTSPPGPNSGQMRTTCRDQGPQNLPNCCRTSRRDVGARKRRNGKAAAIDL